MAKQELVTTADEGRNGVVQELPGVGIKDPARSAQSGPVAWWWWIGVVLLFAALGVPLLAAQVPPLTDYPNHLARCYVLAFMGSDPLLSRMFSAHWQIIPNIAIDLILPPLMHVFLPFTAGRIVLSLCLFAPVSGAIALSYAYFGRRSFWQLTPGFAAFNALFLMGFMNFEIGIGMAMWAAAAWIYYRDRRPWLAIASGMIIAPAVFFFHLMGCFFYALLVGCYELFAILDGGVRERGGLINSVKRAGLVVIPFLAPAYLYLLSPLDKVSSAPEWASYSRKAWSVLVPFLDYSVPLSLLVIAPVIAFLAYCVLTGRVDVSRPGLLAAAILAVAYVVLPTSMKRLWWVDTRMIAMLGFLIFAVFLPRGLSSRQQTASALMVGLLLMAKIALITMVWNHSQRDVRDVQQVIARVEPGSRVLDTYVTRDDNRVWYAAMPLWRRIPHLNPTFWHLGSLVLLDRRAFWPSIFATDNQQPIRARPPYLDALGTGAAPPSYQLLGSLKMTANEAERFPFLPNWEQKFDYVLLLNAEGAGNLEQISPEKLELLDHRGIAVLFRVRK
jgi:hypothetical protein